MPEKCDERMYFPALCVIIDYLRPRSVLHYCCGRARLIGRLAQQFPNVAFYGYDPNVSGRETLPMENADLVIVTNAIEHLSDSEAHSMVERAARISTNVFFAIAEDNDGNAKKDVMQANFKPRNKSWYCRLIAAFFETIFPLKGTKAVSLVLTFALPPDQIRA